jgi:ABC-type sugar transport system permease subunit
MMLIATVALRSISIEVLEAARVDGAIRWSMWWHITWPLIRPVIWSGVLLRGVLLFNAFHLPLMLFNDTRGTGTTTISLASYYSVRYDFGFNSSAMLNIVAMALAIGLIWLFNRRTHVVEGVQYA